MSFSSHIFGKKKVNAPVYIFDAYPNANFGYSFAQLKTGATYAIRQYKLDGSSFQDVGFVDGYVDIISILNFAAGASTRYEMYNQVDNSLELIIRGSETNANRPLLTDASGAINYKNEKIHPFQKTTDVLFSNISGVSGLSTIFTTIENNRNPTILYPTSYSNRYAGAIQNGSGSSAESNIGNPIYFINNIQITTPTTRDVLHDETINIHSVCTIKSMNETVANMYYKTSYNGSGYFAPSYLQEILSFKQSFLTDTDITDISINRQTFYGI